MKKGLKIFLIIVGCIVGLLLLISIGRSHCQVLR